MRGQDTGKTREKTGVSRRLIAAPTWTRHQARGRPMCFPNSSCQRAADLFELVAQAFAEQRPGERVARERFSVDELDRAAAPVLGTRRHPPAPGVAAIAHEILAFFRDSR